MTPMEHWQFLIQKQGDRNWQPLESPNLSIFAGKYRVLARSHLANTSVEVRVIHSSIQEVPPKRRIFKRLRRTNAEGLMAVIPFTDLKPGIWELRCSADLMTNILGKSWQYSLILKVLPLELNEQPLLGSGDQFNEESQVTPTQEDEFAVASPSNLNINPLSTATAEDTIINQPVSPVLFKGETAEQILQSVLDLALPSSESWDEEQPDEDISPVVSPPSPLHLSLERDTYIARWGKTLTVNGYVELAEIDNLANEILSTTNINHCFQLQLISQLRSPLESNILAQFTQPLTDQILPFTFSSIIEIPKDCESKLILANISLYGTLTTGDEVILLASHPFIITADVTELLTVTSAKSREKSSPPDLLPDDNLPATEDVATKPERPHRVSLELFNIVKTPKLAQFHILKPAANKPLPPRIKPLVFLDGSSPTLPKLPRIHKNAIAGNSANADSSLSEGTVNNPSQIPPINLDKLVIKQVKTSFPYLKRLKPATEPNSKTKNNLPKLIEIQLSKPENTPELLPSKEHEETFAVELIENELIENELIENELIENELIENTIPQVPILDIEELNTPEITPQETTVNTTEITPETSALIQKWIKSQGYLLDEGIELVYQEDNTNEDVDTQDANNTDDTSESTDEPPVILNDENPAVPPAFTDELLLNLNLDAEIEMEEVIDLPEHMILGTSEPTPEPESSPNISQLLSQEIVLDDTYMPLSNEDSNQPSEPQEQLLDVSPPVLTSLPTPQLFLPNGELLAGSSIKVRLELSQASSTVVLKLWVEDYQTRGLLDGPHLIQDLRTTPWGNWEAIAQLIVPLGCLEVLVGAIALDTSTQQESHKVTIVKTVIPPNLPTMELDEVLGM
ncbi:hypothetical protein [Sphaerospermopsis sp. LEGE 08334]|uniref:hypothetical protein n=1 Tax=Sphaerospermopsis sp. LEGE 08334 TaxID=1828651 RepID=UPI001D14DA56|nr:hypothetical protein [Sphaerospermopsis sp. LEGE 08334]